MSRAGVCLRRILDQSSTGEFLLECGHRLVFPPWKVKLAAAQRSKRLHCQSCADVRGLDPESPRSKAFWLARVGKRSSPIVRVDQFGCFMYEADIERFGKSAVGTWYFVWAGSFAHAKELLKEGQGRKWKRVGTRCTPCDAKAS